MGRGEYYKARYGGGGGRGRGRGRGDGGYTYPAEDRWTNDDQGANDGKSQICLVSIHCTIFQIHNRTALPLWFLEDSITVRLRQCNGVWTKTSCKLDGLDSTKKHDHIQPAAYRWNFDVTVTLDSAEWCTLCWILTSHFFLLLVCETARLWNLSLPISEHVSMPPLCEVLWWA